MLSKHYESTEVDRNKIKHSYEEQARAYRISWEINTP